MQKHLWEYFKSFGVWGYLTLVLTILSGINTYSNITDNPISTFTIVPTWGWLTILIMGLVIAPFFAFHKLRNRLDEYESTQPNVVFDQCRESPLFQKGQPIFHITQAWFKNSPTRRADSSVARQVTATIEFRETGDTPQQVLRIAGQWVESIAPDFVCFGNTTNKIDILPNDESYKLNIALKWEEDENAYGYALESFIYSQQQDGREDVRKLPRGEHSVYVKLKGVGVDKSFEFTLVNPGKHETLELRPLS